MSQPCLPPSFSLSPATAKSGASITVAADDASCNPRYGENAQIQVEVYDGSGAKVLETLAPMNDAGAFSVSLDLPTDAVPGEGMVAAYPYNVDWCDDMGRNNRVGALGAQEITLVSCAIPSMPLRIEP
ncbi:hypothetical protein [Arthrobacter glacialis]|uniref:hypothetical protein n=1 Tax=Arthrobacter glacialis TaxID=1664 RepID=UPI001FAEE479|nr:hypothetical protein [Arthrobacter glacialis]